MPCLALLGEFSAGKSSIVNLLLGRDMLPTAVLSSTHRPTHVRHAPQLRIETITETGEREQVPHDALKTLVREDIRYINVGMPHELLRQVELLDTPGFADPFRSPERTLDVVGSADIGIWCTLATQAWRQSERQIWLSLPARLRTNGILVVTHVDALAHQGERRRVRTRLKREVGDLFVDIVLLAVPDAMRALGADGQVVDQDLWRDSGGSAMIAALQKAIHYRRASGESGFEKEPAPEASRLSPAPVTPPELQHFLADVMETVPGCLASAWVDLAGRQVLELRGPDSGEIVETTVLGDAITGLFQSNNLQRIEGLFKHSLGLAEDDRHYFREIIIIADGCIGLFLRDQFRADRCLAVVSDRTANLGLMLAKARDALESTRLLM